LKQEVVIRLALMLLSYKMTFRRSMMRFQLSNLKLVSWDNVLINLKTGLLMVHWLLVLPLLALGNLDLATRVNLDLAKQAFKTANLTQASLMIQLTRQLVFRITSIHKL